ncbi:MAG: DUF4287 domain-containing protein [Streptosporangiaceae bacterium]
MTAWAWAALGTAGAFVMAALGDLISEEIRGWLDLAPRAILSLAATRLDPTQRETIYEGEWLPELCYALRGAESRPITRLIRGTTYATSLLIAAHRMARSEPTPRVSAGTSTDNRNLIHSPNLHRSLITRIPVVTGRDLAEWFSRLESAPAFLRREERAHWLADDAGISCGYAYAIVEEYEMRPRLLAARSVRCHDGDLCTRATPSPAWYGSRTSLADLGDLGVAGESGAFVEPS